MKDVYIVDCVRTPVGKAPRGAFSQVRPDDLCSHVLKGLLQRVPDLDPAVIDDVIIGCAMPEAEQGMNIARNALLLADYPNAIPGMTVNRFCASGLETIAIGASRIASDEAEFVVAGGAESMSMVPMGGHKLAPNPKIFEHDEYRSIAFGMGITAERVAQKWKVSREMQEEFALESHRRALAAIGKDAFKDEILPYRVESSLLNSESGEVITCGQDILVDEGPRAGSSMEKLAKLNTVFQARGTITAATSSQMSDGAAAVLLTNEAGLKRFNLTPLAKFSAYRVAGVAPEYMGIGPVAAIPKACNAAGIPLDTIEWIELNEAFAAQTLAVINDLKLDMEKVNPLGGAIALGHPLGATGAIRTATLLHGLKRENRRYGMVTMCIGTGMGAAGIFESL